MQPSSIPPEIPESTERLATQVVDAVFQVRKQLGSGLRENLYKNALGLELTKRGIPFVREHAIEITYDGKLIGTALPDFLIGGELMLEAKAVDGLSPQDMAQALTYMRFTRYPLGLLVNFHAVPLGRGIKRLAPPRP